MAAGLENTLWLQNYSADAVLHMKMQVFLPQFSEKIATQNWTVWMFYW